MNPRLTGVASSAQGHRPVVVAALAGALLVSGCSRTSHLPSDVVARIAGVDVRSSDLDAYLRDNAAGELDPTAQTRLFDGFVDEQLLVRLAVERGFVDSEIDHRRALAFLSRSRLAWTPSDAEVAAYYDAHREDFRRPEEVRVRQILVSNREAAEMASEALAGGESFAAVAARLSTGPKAHLGGDQGRLARDDLPPRFSDLIFDLQPGAVSRVVETDYGFLLFQVAERFPAELRTLADADEEIRSELTRLALDQDISAFIEEARGRYNVRVFPANLPFDYQGIYATEDFP